ncbi:MAG: ATP synthase F0 subunit B [Deltaproteobacteria bacterium]|jgi:F-type H+-transporting ATPase subunit b|nr:ATP synthase F0 subunit B [Deltaproteobacteria bacterium]
MVSVALDWTLVAQLVTFLVLMFVLNQILFKPILNVLREREMLFEDLKGKAASFKDQLEQGEAEEKSERTGAVKEGEKAQNARKLEGQAEERSILEKAQAESAGRLEDAAKDLEAQVAEAKKGLEAEARTLGLDIAQKLLGREIRA